jgi:hypothetical protein
MRPVLLALLLAGCTNTTMTQPAADYHAEGEPLQLAGCTYRAMRGNPNVTLTPMADSAELRLAVPSCGMFGCAPPLTIWVSDFEPDGPGRTRIAHRHFPSLLESFTWEASGVGPAVRACAGTRRN